MPRFQILCLMLFFYHRMLNDSLGSFPSELAIYRVLPSIVSAIEYGGASAATIVPLIVKIGKDVSQEEYNNTILAPIVKLFASPDRGIRMALLDNLPEYTDKLDKKTVDGKIFPNLVGPLPYSQSPPLILPLSANRVFRYRCCDP